MSLRDFQRALCDLIASPRLCLRMRERPDEVLARYELTPREARRLTSVIWQRGMSVNCTLYRVNRITPVYTMLPLTCVLLGDALLPELETFWAEFTDTDLQYKTEIQRFAEFLHRRIEQGHLDIPFLAEVLEFELVVNELRFTSRRRILGDLDRSSIGGVRRAWRAHPLVRVLSFRHDPTVVLGALAEQRMPPSDCDCGEFFLLADRRTDDLTFAVIEPRLARQLLAPAVEQGSPSDRDALIRAGLLVPSTNGTQAPRRSGARRVDEAF